MYRRRRRRTAESRESLGRIGAPFGGLTRPFASLLPKDEASVLGGEKGPDRTLLIPE